MKNMPNAARFWIERAGYGALFGAAIATLEFAYYVPLMPATKGIALASFASLLLAWGGEGVLLALIVAFVEVRVSPRDLRAWELALAVAFGVITGVLIWTTFTQFVLRKELGVRLFPDYMGQPTALMGVVLYHAWLMSFFGGLVAAVYASQRRRARMLIALRAAELGRAAAQRRLAEAQFASLQARLEPGLLLGKLTELERSYERDPNAADRLLEAVITFLRGALAEIRVRAMGIHAVREEACDEEVKPT